MTVLLYIGGCNILLGEFTCTIHYGGIFLREPPVNILSAYDCPPITNVTPSATDRLGVSRQACCLTFCKRHDGSKKIFPTLHIWSADSKFDTWKSVEKNQGKSHSCSMP